MSPTATTTDSKILDDIREVPVKDFQVEQVRDENLGIYGEIEHITYTPEEERRVLWKIDLILLPLLCGCYIFSFLDKTLLNYSSIFGLKKALGLVGQEYSWLGSIFYFGYMLGSILWSKLVQRFPEHVGKFISSAILIWSAIVLLTPLCTNFAGIAVNRFFLGFIESVTGAVFIIVTSNWWTRSEQAFRTGFWLGGTPIGNFIGGLLSYAIGKMHSSIPPWKIFFVFFGSTSFAFAVVQAFLMPDNQMNARWLTPRERKIAVERVRANQNVTSSNEWKWSQMWEALRDPQTLMFFIIAVGNTMPSTFASQFSSSIVKSFGFSSQITTIISTCPSACIQLGSFLIFSYIASKVPNTRLILGVICSVPPLIGASLLHALPTTNTGGRLAGYYLTYTHTLSLTLATSLVSSNYAGHTKKATASAVLYVGYAAGLIAGPQFFLESQAPTYQMAFEMLMVCYALMIVVPLIQLFYYRYENARRDRKCAELGLYQEVNPADLEFTDMTDFQQWKTFRYVM